MLQKCSLNKREVFYSFRLKLLDVVAEAEAELLKVEAEKEVKLIRCGA